MSKTILFASGPKTFSAASTFISNPVGSLGTYNSPYYLSLKCYAAGTVSDLQVIVTGNAIASNTAVTQTYGTTGETDGITSTILASQTGLFESSGSQAISANNIMTYKTVTSAADDLTINHIQMTFAATTNTVTFLGLGYATGYYWDANASFFWPLSGSVSLPSAEPTETTCKLRMRKAGTFKTLRGYVFNYPNANQTFALRKNGADVFTFTALATQTGFVENSSGTSTCAVDDDFNFAVHTGADTASLTFTCLNTEFETTDGSGVLVSGNSSGSTYIKNTTNYTGIGGIPVVGQTTESFAQTYAKEAYTFSNLEGYVTANASDQGGSVTLMKGGVATALTFSTGNVLTGLLQDTSNTVTTTATDLLDIRVINLDTSGGAHSITFRWIALFYTSGAGGGELKYGTITESPSVSVSESLARIQTLLKTISDTPVISVSEALSKYTISPRPISDTPTVTISEQIAKLRSVAKSIAESAISVSESITKIFYTTKSISNEPPVTTSDLVTGSLGIIVKNIVESLISVSEQLAKMLMLPRTIADTPTVTTSEQLVRIQTLVKAISDTPVITTSEQLVRTALYLKPISETAVIVPNESIARWISISYAIAEPSVSISELLEGALFYLRTVTEGTINISESTTRLQTLLKTISEGSISSSESLARVQTLLKSISETSIDTTGSPTRIPTWVKSITNEPSVNIDQLVARILAATRTVADTPTISISEQIARTQSLIKSISETPLSTDDSMARAVTFVTALVEARIKWYYSTFTRKISS